MTDCVLWEGKTDRDGYGYEGRGRAHRLAYAAVHGPIPAGLHVLHSCDNPPCVNVEHLFLGTNLDNIRDKVAKGRARGPARGSGHFNARLTEADVVWIRESNLPLKEMAQQLNVSVPTVSEALTGKTWKNVETPTRQRKRQQ